MGPHFRTIAGSLELANLDRRWAGAASGHMSLSLPAWCRF